MRDQYGVLCDRFALGRQVITTARFVDPTRPRSGRSIRVKIIGDPLLPGRSPGQLSGAVKEAEDVADFFSRLNRESDRLIQFEIDRSHIAVRLSVIELRALLRTQAFDIFHFAGHGAFDASDPGNSGWRVSDGVISARDLRNTLAQSPSKPWIVFSNACQHAGAGREGPRVTPGPASTPLRLSSLNRTPIDAIATTFSNRLHGP